MSEALYSLGEFQRSAAMLRQNIGTLEGELRYQRFGMTGRNVDDEVRNLSLGHGLQVRTDGVDVYALDEFGARLQDRPSLHDESFKAPPGPFGLHLFQLEFSIAHKASRVARALRR